MSKKRGYPYSGHDHTHPALKQVHDSRTTGERVADAVARFGGSWPFIFLFLGIIAGWMLLNIVVLERVLHHKQFDPYPFIALNLVLSAMAGLQAPIIMMSQNRAATRDEALAAHHYDQSTKMDDLLEQNTKLTEQVHELLKQNTDLTQQIRELVERG